MKFHRFLLCFALMSVLLAACASPVEMPPAPIIPTDNDMPIPFPADTPVLIWSRQGGIAGFCDDVTVLADGTYSVVTCKDRATQHGQLGPALLLQLARLVNKIKSFEDENNDPAAADAMSIKITFTGSGPLDASPEDKATLHNFAALLLVQAKPANDGRYYPEAILKARDFLAGQLNIAASEIKITSVEAVEWPDGCLGVVIPDTVVCAQSITPGYRVIFNAQGKSFEIRTDQRGENIRLARN